MTAFSRHVPFLVALCLGFFAPVNAGADGPLVVKVFTGDGVPAVDAEVNLLHQWVWTGWQPVVDGTCSFEALGPSLGGQLNPGARVDVLVRAPGFAPSIADFEYVETSMEHRVVLEIGREVGITLQLPVSVADKRELDVLVFAERHQSVMQFIRRDDPSVRGYTPDSLYPVQVRPVGGGEYSVRLPEDFPPFIVMVDGPPAIRFFQSGPYALASAGAIEVDVPDPASVAIRFDPGSEAGGLFESLRLQIARMNEGATGNVTVLNRRDRPIPFDETIEGLVPGRYWIDMSTHPAVLAQSGPSAGMFRDVAVIDIEAGERRVVEFNFTAFNATPWRGEQRLEIDLVHFDGTPAGGLPYSLQYLDPHYGMFEVASGSIPEDGQVVVGKVNGAAIRFNSVLHHDKGPIPQYTLVVDNGKLGRFPIHVADTGRTEVALSLAPSIGHEAPELQMTDIATGDTVRLEDFRGQIVVLEFWATWCGPCREPLQKLAKLARDREADWRDRVTILAVSIDDSMDIVPPFLEERGLEGPRFAWVGGESTGFEAEGIKLYGISGIPTMLLIDSTGIIRRRGHPAQGGIETQIEALLNEKVEYVRNFDVSLHAPPRT